MTHSYGLTAVSSATALSWQHAISRIGLPPLTTYLLLLPPKTNQSAPTSTEANQSAPGTDLTWKVTGGDGQWLYDLD